MVNLNIIYKAIKFSFLRVVAKRNTYSGHRTIVLSSSLSSSHTTGFLKVIFVAFGSILNRSGFLIIIISTLAFTGKKE